MAKKKTRLNKRIKRNVRDKQTQSQTHCLICFAFMLLVSSFVQKVNWKSLSRLLWHKSKLTVFFFVCSNFSFFHMYFLATLLYKSAPFFTMFSMAQSKSLPKQKQNVNLTDAWPFFCFNFAKHVFVEKKVVFRRTLFSPKSLFWHFQAEVLRNTVSLLFKCYVLSLNVWLLFLFFLLKFKKK